MNQISAGPGRLQAPQDAFCAQERRAGFIGSVCIGLALVLTACGGGGGSGPSAAAPPPSGSTTVSPPTATPGSVNLHVLGVAPSTVTGTVAASDPQGLPLTWSLQTAPLVGSVTVDPKTGVYSYSVSGNTNATSDLFTVRVTNGTASVNANVAVTLQGDPLLPAQWALQNLGASAFSSTPPVAGNDMNIAAAWGAGYSGRGIKVGVVDTGLEAAHEDLAANVDVAHSLNFVTGSNDPTPAKSPAGFDHGTAVAGIIGAVAFNGKGGRGVAYNASLRGYNLLASGAFTLTNMARALGGDPLSADSDLFNASFGATAAALPTTSNNYSNINITTLGLRGGLGAAIINAAGNDFVDWEYAGGTGLCNEANRYGVSCGDPANDERRGGYTPILVGALDANGQRASYSNTGSSLWISAPAGEYGYDTAYKSGKTAEYYQPATVTTNLTGCQNTILSTAVNALDSNGASALAPNCQYTALMNGTSAATPQVAGVVALMLEANPKLSVHDIKYILASTAKRPALAGISSTDVIAGQTVTLEQGWVTNAAGFTFSNWYGFGAIDAAAAVAMAKTYSTYIPTPVASKNYTTTAGAPGTVPAQSQVGRSLTFNVSESMSTVRYVVVFLNIASSPSLSCNAVHLVSPQGTRSILMHAANGFNNFNVANSRILSNAFYGEPVNGTWTLSFYDYCAPGFRSTALSTFNPQMLAVIGN